MKILVAFMIIATSLTGLAQGLVHPTPSQRYQFQKDMALKYLDIAIFSADARENKQLICETGTYVSEITKVTLQAIETARYVNDSAFTVRVLKAITSNKALQQVVGSQVSYRFALATPTLGYSTEAMRAALIGSTLYGPALGVMGNISEITFGGNGTVKVVSKDWIDEEPYIKYTTSYTTFSVSQNSEYATIVTIGGTRYKMVQGAEGFMLIPENSDDPNDGYRNGFAEYPSECEA